MADVQITLKLSEESKQFLKRFPSNFKTRFRRGLYLAMKHAEAKSKASFGNKVPSSPGQPPAVRTGMLRRSVGSDVDVRGDDYVGVLFATTIYSRILELGGGHIDARPYLEPAIRDNMSTIEDIIEKEILRSAE